MYDDVQNGWLVGDGYRVAAEAAGVVELPDTSHGDPPMAESGAQDLPAGLLGGRFEDPCPPRIGE
jgi:hypothetical protein